MNKRIAIIDLGTNTFHLLIVDVDASNSANFEIVHKQKVFVKLGEFGLQTFKPKVIERALETINDYHKIVIESQVDDVLIFGTAGLRLADNTAELIEKIEHQTNWKVKVISGTKEATLIYYGVKQTIDFENAFNLIMDIGGGSVEFILANKSGILWSSSFNIGAALLRKQFHVNEPISYKEIDTLNTYLDEVLIPLKKTIEKYPCDRLIGASGSFDTIADISLNSTKSQNAIELKLSDFTKIYNDLISKNDIERLNTENLVEQRADMIVVSLILIKYALDNFKIKRLYKSDYALKEGMLWAYFNDRKLIS